MVAVVALLALSGRNISSSPSGEGRGDSPGEDKNVIPVPVPGDVRYMDSFDESVVRVKFV